MKRPGKEIIRRLQRAFQIPVLTGQIQQFKGAEKKWIGGLLVDAGAIDCPGKADEMIQIPLLIEIKRPAGALQILCGAGLPVYLQQRHDHETADRATGRLFPALHAPFQPETVCFIVMFEKEVDEPHGKIEIVAPVDSHGSEQTIRTNRFGGRNCRHPPGHTVSSRAGHN